MSFIPLSMLLKKWVSLTCVLLSFWLVQDVYQRCRLTPQKFEDTKAYLKEKASLNSDLVADGADLLRVMPTTGYVAFLHKSNFAAQPAFSGWMGLICSRQT